MDLARQSISISTEASCSATAESKSPNAKRQAMSVYFDKENYRYSELLLNPTTGIYPQDPKEDGAAIVITNTKNPDNTFYPVPLGPPMMRFASSAAFSDVTMPIHGLTCSKSFGPSGLFGESVGSSNPSGSSIAFPEVRTPVLPSSVHFTMGEIGHLSKSNHNHNKTNHLSSNVNLSVGDLNMAASALLDLTPSVIPRGQRSFPFPYGRHSCTSQNNRGDTVPTHGAMAHLHASHARLEARAYRLLNNVPDTFLACKCKNTKCLKLYCTCFQTGAFCDALICKCKGCNNTKEHSMPRGTRTIAVYEILSRRIDAFEPRLRKKTGGGCSCKKSR